ncbi:hypothetical protein [Streptomyces sp. DH8]|uniref:hypothetical protein n=1 Tax=Streptomyces sp. DH8 TaxID=2857008 RepID=UPI001E2C1B17|nr:hypothetical protein [Streptomyces sp. DH8]
MKLLAFFRRRPAPTPFSPVGITAGTRWLCCDELPCGHLATPHTPDGTGYRCTQCGTVKGADQ